MDKLHLCRTKFHSCGILVFCENNKKVLEYNLLILENMDRLHLLLLRKFQSCGILVFCETNKKVFWDYDLEIYLEILHLCKINSTDVESFITLCENNKKKRFGIIC